MFLPRRCSVIPVHRRSPTRLRLLRSCCVMLGTKIFEFFSLLLREFSFLNELGPWIKRCKKLENTSKLLICQAYHVILATLFAVAFHLDQPCFDPALEGTTDWGKSNFWLSGKWEPWIPPQRGNMGGGNSNQSTAAKVWQNQKYEDFITAAVVWERTAGEDL